MTSSRVQALSKGQTILLDLLHALKGRRSRLNFQKLLFLYCQDQRENVPYNFIPHQYGAFSYESYADCRRLMKRGYIAEDEKNWILTEKGQRAVSGNACHFESIRKFTKQWSSMTNDALIAETYRRFPYFATRSDVASRILRNDPDTLDRIEQARPKAGQLSLVTIGYEGRSLDLYLHLLYTNGVTVLCDVRRNALSRKYGFSKQTLGSSCQKIGIQYQHLPQLGIASAERRDLLTRKNRDALFEKYRRTCLPCQQDALHIIRSWLADGQCVALTCYERQPEQCHRHCVADALQKKAERNFNVKHL